MSHVSVRIKASKYHMLFVFVNRCLGISLIISTCAYLRWVVRRWKSEEAFVRRWRKVTLNRLWGINQFVSKRRRFRWRA